MGRIDERGRVCATFPGECRKFGSSSRPPRPPAPAPPLRCPACFNQGRRRDNQTVLETKSFHMGAVGKMGVVVSGCSTGLATLLTLRRAAKGAQSVRGHGACLHFLLSVSEGDWLEGGWMLMCPSVQVASHARTHKHTHRLVFDTEKAGRVFPVSLDPPPLRPSSHPQHVETLAPPLNSCRQAPGGKTALRL